MQEDITYEQWLTRLNEFLDLREITRNDEFLRSCYKSGADIERAFNMICVTGVRDPFPSV